MQRRIGAGTYLLAMSLSIIVWSVSVILLCEKLALPGLINPTELNRGVSLMGAALAMLFYPLSASRLRDLNFPAWTIWTLSFPLITIIILPMLCFLSGPRWENDYGQQAPKSGLLKTLLALAACGIAICSLYSASSNYYGTRYLLAHSIRPS